MPIFLKRGLTLQTNILACYKEYIVILNICTQGRLNGDGGRKQIPLRISREIFDIQGRKLDSVLANDTDLVLLFVKKI